MERKLNFAIVGTGSRGISCFGALLKERTDCTIRALCDLNRVRAKAQAEKLGVSQMSVSRMEKRIREMFRSEFYGNASGPGGTRQEK